MKPFNRQSVLTLISLATLTWIASGAWADSLNTAKIEQLTGAKGTLDPTEGVFKVSVPRSDLGVTVAGVKMVPPLGLTSWAAFQPAGARTVWLLRQAAGGAPYSRRNARLKAVSVW